MISISVTLHGTTHTLIDLQLGASSIKLQIVKPNTSPESSSGSNLGMESLPTELLSKICQLMDKPALLALRFVSREISTHPTQWAFRRVRLVLDSGPYSKSIRCTNNILNDPSLRRWVHHFCFDTDQGGYGVEGYLGYGSQTDISGGLKLALSRISYFSNLRSISLQFCGETFYKSGKDPYYGVDPEPPAFRAEVLSFVVHALHNPVRQMPYFHTLSIKGLHDHNDSAVTASPAFHAALARVRALKLLIISDGKPGEEGPLSLPELHDFFRELPELWLHPPTAHLTTLHLLLDRGKFGYCPRLDLRGTHFPALRVLALGNYTFTHDWQFEWIQDHGDTLRTLIMDSCPIVYYMNLPAPDAEGYPSDPRVDYGACSALTYEKRWKTFFRTLGSGDALPWLLEFRFGASWAWDDRCTAFERLEALQPQVYRDMYMAFDRNVSWPSPWISKPREEGQGVCLDYEEDREAFEELQGVLSAAAGGGLVLGS
ncbi:hypothetical protein BD779DRAFT_564652 [Infundibulicybe gibba]|nr:hypothetical protein BD779DRAFT_564652 [Infundibulicybe gibba]